MDGFTAFFKSWFFMFLLGAIFGKAIEKLYPLPPVVSIHCPIMVTLSP